MGMKLLHICEACGKTEVLDSDEAYRKGWDYPPNMGKFGVVSPRTCESCTVDKTLWWALVVEKKSLEDLSEKQKGTLARILGEPESVAVEGEGNEHRVQRMSRQNSSPCRRGNR